MEGNYIRKFSCMQACLDFLGIKSKTTMKLAIKSTTENSSFTKSGYGYRWSLTKVLKLKVQSVISTNNRRNKVGTTLTKNGVTVEYRSLCEAAKFLKVHKQTISNAKRNGRIIQGYQIQEI